MYCSLHKGTSTAINWRTWSGNFDGFLAFFCVTFLRPCLPLWSEGEDLIKGSWACILRPLSAEAARQYLNCLLRKAENRFQQSHLMFKVIALVCYPDLLSFHIVLQQWCSTGHFYTVAGTLQCVSIFHLHGKAHRDESQWKKHLLLFVLVQQSPAEKKQPLFHICDNTGTSQGHQPFFSTF